MHSIKTVILSLAVSILFSFPTNLWKSFSVHAAPAASGPIGPLNGGDPGTTEPDPDPLQNPEKQNVDLSRDRLTR